MGQQTTKKLHRESVQLRLRIQDYGVASCKDVHGEATAYINQSTTLPHASII